MTLLTWVKSLVRRYILRKKFPTSVIHSGSIIDQYSFLGKYSVLFQDVVLMNSSLGAYSYIQSGSIVCNTEIGKFCSISSNVSIGLANHPLHLVSTSPIFYDNSQPLPKFFINSQIIVTSLPRTVIGADVWIGQSVIIKAGVTIGVGAVIGTGSIVTKDILPYTIAAGNPCRPIRQRFAENICDEMIRSKWWDLDEDKLKKLAPNFENVDVFLRMVKNS